MNIVFLDPVGMDYNVETPLTEPLGGTQSAICYLSAELARQHHEVSLVNRAQVGSDYRGVHCVPWAEGRGSDLLHRADVIVGVNFGAASKLRREGVRAPLVLWAHHRFSQIAMRGLQDDRERAVWSAFAFVSEWMADEYIRLLGVPPERCRVMHNGIGEPFAQQKPIEPWFMENRAPVLAYTSMPNRGLDVLLDAFPIIRSAFPDVRLRVYSGGRLYQTEQEPDSYRRLYERCRQMQGVEYVGPVGQTQLASELKGAAALAYPATIPETFCLAAAEAMSLGAMLLTTKLGAISELFGEFAFVLDTKNVNFPPDGLSWIDAAGTSSRARAELVIAFGALVIDALGTAKRDPAREARRRSAQIAFVRSRYTWPRVVAEWSRWLEGIAGS